MTWLEDELSFFTGHALVQYNAATDIQNLFDNVLDDSWYSSAHGDHTGTTLDLPDSLDTPPVDSTITFPKSEPDMLDGYGTMSTEDID